MIASPHHPSGLSKATWTDADFLDMGWHDCRVHAVSIGEYDDDTMPPARLLLDLDYIVRWVEPAPREPHFTFWISPATLVFERAWNITGEFGPLHEIMEISDVHRLNPPDDNPEPLWHIEGQNFELRLRSPGYTQHLRLPPQHVHRQMLTTTQRPRRAVLRMTGGARICRDACAPPQGCRPILFDMQVILIAMVWDHQRAG